MRIEGLTVDRPREGKFYLLLRCPEGGDASWVLSESPGRTNSSHQERFSGWLGTTNGISWHAHEAIEVSHDGEKWRYRRFQAEQLVAEEEAEEVRA